MGRTMTRRRTLPILLAFALLLTQAAGYAHALSHFNGDTLAKERMAHASLCAKCASFDKLSLIEPTSRALDLRVEAASTPVIAMAQASQPRTVATFQPRAPPYFV
jgi:hypothetical protein